VAVTSDTLLLDRRRLTAPEVGFVNGRIVADCYRRAISSEPWCADEAGSVRELWESHPPHASTRVGDDWHKFAIRQQTAGGLDFVRRHLYIGEQAVV